MTRLFQNGYESQYYLADSPYANAPVNGTWTYDTATKNNGLCSRKVVGTSVDTYQEYVIPGVVTGRTYYGRAYINLPGLPTFAAGITYVKLLTWGDSGAEYIAAAIRQSDNKLYLYDVVNAAFIGSGVTISTGVQHRIELAINISTSTNDDYGELLLDGVSVASSTTLNLSTAAPNYFETMIEWSANDAGNALTAYFDDLAINDNQGSVNNSWCGAGGTVPLFSISDNANGGWSKPGGGTTNLNTSVDNTPPVGVANSTSSGDAEKMIRNPNSTSSQSYDANMTSYTTAGIGANDIINAVQWVMAIGTSSVTGANNGTARLVSNPDQGSDQTINFEGTGAAQGTYPTDWFHEYSPIIERPSVTKGTSPVLRITKTTSATRVHNCCIMIIMVDFTVATGITVRRTLSDRVGSRS